MNLINRQELGIEKFYYFGRIRKGAVFIHPTDTIYGLGCDATNPVAVAKLRDIKQRSATPFSVIAPGIGWIRKNCVVRPAHGEWLGKLPGPYTLVFQLSNRSAVAPEVNCGLDTLGVRVPRHWFSKVVEELGFPVVTTSANISGQDFMTSIDNIDSRVASRVDFAIYEGEKKGTPSTVVKLVEEVEVLKR